MGLDALGLAALRGKLTGSRVHWVCWAVGGAGWRLRWLLLLLLLLLHVKPPARARRLQRNLVGWKASEARTWEERCSTQCSGRR